MKIALTTVLYCGVMLYLSSISNDLLINALCLLVVGPILCLISIISFILSAKRRSLSPSKVLPPTLCLVAVLVWTLGFWQINKLLEPLVFASVAKENEHLAVAFMQQHPPDVTAEVSGFRYPYYSLGDHIEVYHHNGIVFFHLPSFLNRPYYVIYLSPGSTFPNQSDGLNDSWYETRQLTGRWYWFHITVGQ